MHFLCIGFFNARSMSHCSDSEVASLMAACEPHLKALYDTRAVCFDIGVDNTVLRLSRVGDEISHAEGGDNQEQRIGSVFLIAAEDMGEAVRIAALHPALQVSAGEAMGWTVEVRTVHYLEQLRT